MPRNPDSERNDRSAYRAKRDYFDRLLTIYGRKPVLEVLREADAVPIKLHLSNRNKPAPILDEIIQLATSRGAEQQSHSPESLSRISKNARQDQGVALDVQCASHRELSEFLADLHPEDNPRFIALDGITNPQNLGMIIRSVTAGNIDGLIVPRKGCAAISPLVMKASAGTLLRCPLMRCADLTDALLNLKQQGWTIASLSAEASSNLFEFSADKPAVYVLGNETTGVSHAVQNLADVELSIPMQRRVESLNVAVTASLIAFLGSA